MSRRIDMRRRREKELPFSFSTAHSFFPLFKTLPSH
jgi:hypothetical protein